MLDLQSTRSNSGHWSHIYRAFGRLVVPCSQGEDMPWVQLLLQISLLNEENWQDSRDRKSVV